MSFVPLTGAATFRVGVPPREGVVEFSDERRRVALPVRAALPVLTRAQRRDDLHPTVGLLSGAALLGLRLVAAGRLEPHPDGAGWRIAPLDSADDERVRRLAVARAHDGLDVPAAEALVRTVLDAVADAVPTAPPSTSPARRPSTSPAGHAPDRPATGVATGVATPPPVAAAATPATSFHERLRVRLERADRRRRARTDSALPQLVRVALRVEADLDELVAGRVRLVVQVQDEHDPVHVCDAADLWAEPADVEQHPHVEQHPDVERRPAHGFGGRARTHASIALRGAAAAWPVLDRLLEQPVPDQLMLDGGELASLLEDGVAALAGRGVDVLWPRSLGRDLTTSVVLEHTPAGRPAGGRPAGRATPAGSAPARDGDLQTGLFTARDAFDFSWRAFLHGDPLTDEEMDQLAGSSSPLLRLRGNWTVVDPAVARRARKRLVRHLEPAAAMAAMLTGSVPSGATSRTAGQDGDGVDAEPVVLGASLLRVRERLRSAPRLGPADPPATLATTLRDYQRRGLAFLAELTDLGLGACLADDMGLGKTVTLIALHLRRHEQGAVGPTLVVCPTSLLGNWEAEIRRFAPGEPVRRFHGGDRSLQTLDGGFVLTTYGTVRTSHEQLAEVLWDLVVADEAQHVKNGRSATAQALRVIPSAARIALTGTPVENDLTELWSILDWVVPGLLGSRGAFRRVWAAPIESGNEPARARQFAELVAPFLLRRRKGDPGVAPELPAKTETDHPVGLTREQVVLYESFCRDTLARIERADDEATRRGLVLALLTGLKQICNHPAHFLKQSGAVRLAGRSHKLDLVEELLGTVLAEGGAALVFTQYVAMARLLQAHLDRSGVPHQLLHGGTPVREREAMVARFQDGDAGPPVFLLSLKAGGTGLNLTRADHVVHVDRWWNPAVEQQATDRAHRIGQTRPVQVHRILTRGTIEERIALLLRRKQDLAEAVLGRGEAALTSLDDAELRDLVTLRRDDARRYASGER